MDGLSILDSLAWDPASLKLHPAYTIGNAAAWLSKTGAAVGVNHYLSGRLYLSKSGWLLLSVPNALVRGVFDAMTAPGAELPTLSAFQGEPGDKDVLNAHITVMTGDEVEKIGPDKISERGHHFHYALGQVREFTPDSNGLNRVWAIQAASPELAALRKSYGLSPLPNEDHQFHITVAVRRRNVLRNNSVSRVTHAEEEDAMPVQGSTRGELKAAAVKDILPGVAADHVLDSKFPPKTTTEGQQHECEHTANDQIAKEIAKDHLSEDPRDYQKIETVEKFAAAATLSRLHEAKKHSDNKRYEHKNNILRQLMTEKPDDWQIDDDTPKYKGVTHSPTKFRFHVHPTAIPPGVKKAGSVYLNQAMQMFNPAAVNNIIPYDHAKPVFENIQNQLAEVKRRGDFMLQTRRNHDIWRAQLDPNYRYQMALKAFRGELPQPSLQDQLFERYGDGALASLPRWRR